MGANESVVIIIENCTLGYKLPGFLDRYFLSVRCRSLSPSFPACAAGFCLKRPYGLTCELGLCAASIVLVHQVLPLRLYIDLFVCVFLPGRAALRLLTARCCRSRCGISVAAYGPARRVCSQHHSGSSGLAVAFVHRFVCVCVFLPGRAVLRVCSLLCAAGSGWNGLHASARGPTVCSHSTTRTRQACVLLQLRLSFPCR